MEQQRHQRRRVRQRFIFVYIETGKITFRTLRFAPSALVQYSYLEFPFKDWTFESIGIDRALVTIHGKLNEIKILIGEGFCQCIAFAEETHSEKFTKWIPTMELFKVISF
jgi:hypothetical protein